MHRLEAEQGRKREDQEKEEEQKSLRITSLDETSLVFPKTYGIKREGNTIIHDGGENSFRNCFIGRVMTSVYFNYLLLFVTIYLSSFQFFSFLICD